MKKKEERDKEKKKKEGSLLKDYNFSETKLVITKFDGTHFDWFRFWNQFESQVDKCDLTQVSKYSYLKDTLTAFDDFKNK